MGLFALKRNGTTVRREVVAGLTTFAAMAYILAVNPQVLGAAGMEVAALVTVTALAAAVGTALMGLLTNYPIALAPGMGINAFFAYTVCLKEGVPWQGALAFVFWNGVLFVALSLTGVRGRIVTAIPHQLKVGIQAGIGLFIAFIGFKNAGIVAADPATLVALGDLGKPAALLALVALVGMLALVARRVPGAILIVILGATVVGLFLPGVTGEVGTVVALPASVAPTFLAVDFLYPFKSLDFFLAAVPLVLTFLMVDLFDTVGTLVGVSRSAGLVDREGNLPRMDRALLADSTATVVGACLGTSTVTSYIESAAGVESGGRTGLTALVAAACFLAAMFFHPLIAAVPAAATAPALIVVGLLMARGLRELEWDDLTACLPALAGALLMPLTFSITYGLAAGFALHCVLMVLLGRAREVSPLLYGASALLAALLVIGA